MMARGRGGAIGGVLALALLVGLFVAASAPVAEAAASYMVGDYGGWRFNVDKWAKGRTFRAGDVLGTYICRQRALLLRVTLITRVL
jgi:carbohydrate-selective porin OprB